MTGPIKVMHVGLGPDWRRRRASGRGAERVSHRRRRRHRSGEGRARSRRGRRASAARCASRCRTTSKKAIKAAKPDVVVLCTSSSMKKVLPQIEEILKLKVPIVSTTEELAYPTKGNMKYARAIHALAKKAKVAVLGTGVNPGFAMDALPIALTGVCERVDAIACRSRPGRAHPPAAVPAEDRRRAHARAVPEEGGRRQRAARRAGRVDLDDRRRARLEARSDHRRDPAEDRGRDRGERVPRRRARASSAASCRTASAIGTASR